jgi:RNA polymerase sigma factor (sigma-70 family)
LKTNTALPAGVPGSAHNIRPRSFVYTGERRKILILEQVMTDQDRQIAETIEREQGRLRSFIRKRVPDIDAEDVLQDVLFELVEAYRLMKPIERAGAWLFRVARHRIIDRFRKRKPETSLARSASRGADDGEQAADGGSIEDLLPSADAGPEAAYARSVLLDEIEAALGELPEEQRFVFVGHELEGKSFRELASETGLSVNTLLSRKHYAVLHLRRRLRDIYDEFKEKGWSS